MSSVSPIARGAVYRFDRFELSEEREQLRKRGVVVHLAPQSFRLLLLLVSRAGRVVTREEIQAELWGSATFVDFEQGINAAVRRIRFALNDSAETPRFLQTLPRRGYCFVAPVERFDPEETIPAAEGDRGALREVAAPNAEPPVQERRRISHAAIALLVVMIAAVVLTRGPHQQRSSAMWDVKPLRVSMVEGEGDAYTTALRQRLARMQPERITWTTANAPADVRIVILPRNASDGRRVEALLLDGATGRALWRETLAPTVETSEFPFEAAVRISRAFIEQRLRVPQHRMSVRSHAAPRALALYREGLAMRRAPVPQRDLDRAVELFEKALMLEPRFAEAWSAIGDVWTERTLLWMGESRRTAMTQARTALDRALVLDPELAEALNDRGLLLMRFERKYAEAEASMRKAIAADPAYVDAHCNLALLLSAMGRHVEALESMRRAEVLDPETYSPSSLRALLELMARRFGDARAEYHALLVLAPHSGVARRGMLSSAIATRQWDDAASSLSVLLKERIEIPPDGPDRAAVLRQHLRRLAPTLIALERGNQLDPYTLACLHAESGEVEAAFAALDRAIASQSTGAMLALVDPRLDALRSDPRFLDRLDQLGFIR